MAYTYIIENKITKEFYIGCRLKDITPEEDLWIKYFTSSKYVKQQIIDYGKNSFNVEIIATYTDKNKCYLDEKQLIKCRIVDPLCLNKHYREGDNILMINKGHSEETRKKISKSNMGKPSHYGRPSYFLGKTHNIVTRKNLSDHSTQARPVSINGVIYKSIQAAVSIVGLSWTTIAFRCKSPNFPEYIQFGTKQSRSFKRTIETKQAIADKLFNDMYHSISDGNYDTFRTDFIEKVQELTNTTYMSAEVMYVTARKDFKEIMIPQIKTGKQISIDGIIYPSIAMAARRLNTTETTIICRCRSEKYPDWFRL